MIKLCFHSVRGNLSDSKFRKEHLCAGVSAKGNQEIVDQQQKLVRLIAGVKKMMTNPD